MSQNGNVSMTDQESAVKPSYRKTEITLIKILCCLFALFTFLADVGSDIYVAVKHQQNGNKIYLHLTILFVILPAVIMSLASFRWYMMDNSNPNLKVTKTHWIIRTIGLVLLMAPALRSGEALYYARKSYKSEKPVDKENYARRVIYENTDAAFLRLIEAFMECAPQLILQIYIVAQVFCNGSNNVSTTEIAQLISIAISLVSMTNAIVSYFRNLRESVDYKKELTWCISLFPFLCQFFDLAARVLVLGLFASVLLPYFFLVCGIHFCTMLLWIRFMNTNFCDDNKFAEFVYNLVISFIYIFCFINPKDEPTLLRSSLYYSLIFVENTILISVWYHLCMFEARLVVLIIVFVFFILAMIIKVVYYVLLHPTRGTLFKETNLEEINVKSESRNSIVDKFTQNWIDRSRKKEISKEMQTATGQNENPAELKHLNEEKVECSDKFTQNWIDRSRKKEMSKEMQTAPGQNENPAELKHLNEEQVECSEL